MAGSATFTTETSRTTRNCPAQTSSITSHGGAAVRRGVWEWDWDWERDVAIGGMRTIVALDRCTPHRYIGASTT
ncbi:class-III aminotransferase [Streptomyces sp. NBRC 110611]|nr:class-III aminotransferase [Streptomyces sp. NBRC 110611]